MGAPAPPPAPAAAARLPPAPPRPLRARARLAPPPPPRAPPAPPRPAAPRPHPAGAGPVTSRRRAPTGSERAAFGGGRRGAGRAEPRLPLQRTDPARFCGAPPSAAPPSGSWKERWAAQPGGRTATSANRDGAALRAVSAAKARNESRRCRSVRVSVPLRSVRGAPSRRSGPALSAAPPAPSGAAEPGGVCRTMGVCLQRCAPALTSVCTTVRSEESRFDTERSAVVNSSKGFVSA